VHVARFAVSVSMLFIAACAAEAGDVEDDGTAYDDLAEELRTPRTTTYDCTHPPSSRDPDPGLFPPRVLKIDTKAQRATLDGKVSGPLDPTYRPRSNTNYVRFKADDDAQYLRLGTDIQILVERPLLSASSRGGLKIRGSGDALRTAGAYYSCVRR
jgi:hypothetical protein